MRRLLAAVLVLALSACAPGPEPSTVEDVTVTGEFGTVPVVEFPPPLTVDEPVVRTVDVGAGDPVEEGQPTILCLSTFRGEDGAVVDGAGAPVVVRATDELGPVLHEAVVGATEGSRLLYVEPVDAQGTVSTYVTVVDVMPTRASGEEVSTGTQDVTVTMSQDGPTLAVTPGAARPGRLSITPLVRGTGPQVLPDSRVVAHYTAWTWTDGAVHDTTWHDAPAVIDLDTALPGVRDGLVDAAVGSRLLLLIPAAEGLGTDALVMVVDVLAIA